MEKRDGFAMKLLVYISLIFPLIVLGQKNAKFDETFDPTSLNDWKQSKASIEKLVSLKEHLAHYADQHDENELVEYSAFVYQVQLSSTADYEAAIGIENRANQTFAEEVMIQFDSPYYKIRVGRMKNREDAQSLQQFAIDKGYRRAWVIRTENTPPKEK